MQTKINVTQLIQINKCRQEYYEMCIQNTPNKLFLDYLRQMDISIESNKKNFKLLNVSEIEDQSLQIIFQCVKNNIQVFKNVQESQANMLIKEIEGKLKQHNQFQKNCSNLIKNQKNLQVKERPRQKSLSSIDSYRKNNVQFNPKKYSIQRWSEFFQIIFEKHHYLSVQKIIQDINEMSFMIDQLVDQIQEKQQLFSQDQIINHINSIFQLKQKINLRDLLQVIGKKQNHLSKQNSLIHENQIKGNEENSYQLKQRYISQEIDEIEENLSSFVNKKKIQFKIPLSQITQKQNEIDIIPNNLQQQDENITYDDHFKSQEYCQNDSYQSIENTNNSKKQKIQFKIPLNKIINPFKKFINQDYESQQETARFNNPNSNRGNISGRESKRNEKNSTQNYVQKEDKINNKIVQEQQSCEFNNKQKNKIKKIRQLIIDEPLDLNLIDSEDQKNSFKQMNYMDMPQQNESLNSVNVPYKLNKYMLKPKKQFSPINANLSAIQFNSPIILQVPEFEYSLDQTQKLKNESLDFKDISDLTSDISIDQRYAKCIKNTKKNFIDQFLINQDEIKLNLDRKLSQTNISENACNYESNYLECYGLPSLILQNKQFNENNSQNPKIKLLKIYQCCNMNMNMFTNVKILNISFNKLQNCQIISNMMQLEFLNISYNQIQSLNGIQKIKDIQELHANHNYVKELKPLSELYKLRLIDFGYNHIHNIESIKSLTQLDDLFYLNVTGCPLMQIKDQKSVILAILPNLKILINQNQNKQDYSQYLNYKKCCFETQSEIDYFAQQLNRNQQIEISNKHDSYYESEKENQFLDINVKSNNNYNKSNTSVQDHKDESFTINEKLNQKINLKQQLIKNLSLYKKEGSDINEIQSEWKKQNKFNQKQLNIVI